MNVWSSWIFENAAGENCSHFTERKKTIQFSSFFCLTTLPPKNPKIAFKKQQEQDRVVQSWVKITQGLNSAKFEFQMWKHQTQLDVPEGFSKIQLVGQRYRDKTF